MNRYLLFTGYNCYPNGGWEDFQGDYDTIEEAEARVERDKLSYQKHEWMQIIDSHTKEEVVIKMIKY
jgi:hypothetical protein